MQSSSSNGLHVAIIMDGNGRWATRRGLPRAAGHRAGVAAVRRVVEQASELGIRTLTLYAFSADNWRRPPGEVQTIFWLLRAYLRLEREKLRQSGARLEAIGRRDRIPQALLNEILGTEAATAQCERLHLRVAIDYSSRDAITLAATSALGQQIGGRQEAESDFEECPSGAKAPVRNGSFKVRAKARTLHALDLSAFCPVDVLRPLLTEALTADCGEVDLLIRTGDEKRLSDFLLWESAYAELYFTDRMWPEFGAADLEDAIADFRHRQRRFGGVPDAVPAAAIHEARTVRMAAESVRARWPVGTGRGSVAYNRER